MSETTTAPPMAHTCVSTAPATTPQEQELPGSPDQVRVARAFVAAVLACCPVADDAILCVSELAGNAVLHSNSKTPGGTFTVRAEIHHGDYVWVEVEDDGGPWQDRGHDDSRPHGLDVVRALADDWGVDGDPLSGWAVWVRLDVPSQMHHTEAAAAEAATRPR
jgi:hypothetical protein